MSKPIIIGIAGGSASGKTTISRTIQERFKERTSVVTIRQDDYYKDQSHLTMERIVDSTINGIIKSSIDRKTNV